MQSILVAVSIIAAIFYLFRKFKVQFSKGTCESNCNGCAVSKFNELEKIPVPKQ
jgi:hypothetical protein